MHIGTLFSILSLLSSHHFVQTFAALVNVTVDDTYGDPRTGNQFVYTPSQIWNFGPTCIPCFAKPDASQAYLGTWHDGAPDTALNDGDTTGTMSIEISFSGSAIYVYCILSESATSLDGNSDMSFYIDGELVGTYVHAATGSSTYEYNVLVYGNASLPSAEHQFSLVGGRVTGSASLILFDYLVYSQDVESPAPTSSSTSSQPSNTGSSTTSEHTSSASSSGTTAPPSGQTTSFGSSRSGNPTSSSSSSSPAPSPYSETTDSPTSNTSLASGALPTSTSSIAQHTQAAGGISAKTRTIIAVVAAIGGTLLLLAISAATYLWMRRRYAAHAFSADRLMRVGTDASSETVEDARSSATDSRPSTVAEAKAMSVRSSRASRSLYLSGSGASLSRAATVGSHVPQLNSGGARGSASEMVAKPGLEPVTSSPASALPPVSLPPATPTVAASEEAEEEHPWEFGNSVVGESRPPSYRERG
ncbi:hypothetical protein A0H81_00321 [Grifola frondosa]|uniref:Uncharacterized protein n=1 Tax=Grifola frondosa TaxID=5627 RepID=A0A1C7MPZ1_GRIFR|nr:hypothetical protein A0H81_00321 [Grifola frondosa]